MFKVLTVISTVFVNPPKNTEAQRGKVFSSGHTVN